MSHLLRNFFYGTRITRNFHEKFKFSRSNSSFNSNQIISDNESIVVENIDKFFCKVILNNERKKNSMDMNFFNSIRNIFSQFTNNITQHKVVNVCNNGTVFSSGLDLMDFGVRFQQLKSKIDSKTKDSSRIALELLSMLKSMQESFSVIRNCPIPVICSMNGPCIGSAFELIASSDIRLATIDTWFQIKEIDLSIAADLGALHVGPKIISNDSLFRQLSFTGRKFNAHEAKEIGLVSEVFSSKNEMENYLNKLIKEICQKSPIAIRGTKKALNDGREKNTQDGLSDIAIWNMAMLQSDDIFDSFQSMINKKPAEYKDI